MGERPERLPEIVEFYERGLEETRLGSGDGLLEFDRTCALLERLLPPAPARVLDVGGGPGRYAAWLADNGYDVTLVDPVPLHVEQARARSSAQPERPFEAAIGDVRALAFADASFDAVLMLGPLYHLVEREDRMLAWREAVRIARPGASIAAAGITRFAALLDGGIRGWLATKPAFRDEAYEGARTGRHRAVDEESFTWAYFHHPDELRAEALESGLAEVRIVAIEGPWGLLGDLDARRADEAQWHSLLDAAQYLESEPSLLGVSAHLLATGRKPA